MLYDNEHFTRANALAAAVPSAPLNWLASGPVLEKIIEALFAGYREYLGVFWSAVDDEAVREQIVRDVLEMDVEHGWDAPRMSDAIEDMFLTWLTNQVINSARQDIRSESSQREIPFDHSGLDRILRVSHQKDKKKDKGGSGVWKPPRTDQTPPGIKETSQIEARLDVSRLVQLSGMTRRQAEVWLLAELEGLTETNIADQLGMRVGTVKSHLHRAREKLGPIVKRM